jgi:hypothetical protein
LTYLDTLYILQAVIKSWASAESKALFEGEESAVLPAELLRDARRKLMILDAAVQLEDLQILTRPWQGADGRRPCIPVRC